MFYHVERKRGPGDNARLRRTQYNGIYPERLRNASKVQIYFITSSEGVEFEILSGLGSPNEAWSEVVEHSRASSLKERRQSIIAFYAMMMEHGEHLREFFIRVDRMMNETERGERPVNLKDVDMIILSRLMSHYEADVRIPGSSSDWSIRRWIECAVIKR